MQKQEYVVKNDIDYDSIPELFRGIINEYEYNNKRVPTSDELIWLSSERLHFNIRTLY